MQQSEIEKIKDNWINSSDKDFQTMENLMRSKDYSWALFIGHIVLERLLKALYVHINKENAPFSHDLLRIAKLSNLDLSAEYADWLDKITTFNLNARYDSYKQEFYRKCTPEFAGLWEERIKELRTWIKARL